MMLEIFLRNNINLKFWKEENSIWTEINEIYKIVKTENESEQSWLLEKKLRKQKLQNWKGHFCSGINLHQEPAMSVGG